MDHHAWLAKIAEEPIDADLLICDPHHHLWNRPGDRYLLEDVLRDTGGGHRIAQTVFVECRAMYREEGPEELRPVGETEFVEAIASRSASGRYGPTEIAAGIVGFADLTLGAAVGPVLEAHIESGNGRFRGVRHQSAWDPSPDVPTRHVRPRGLLLEPRFREGFSRLQELNLSFDAWLFHPQLMELVDLARAFPNVSIVLDHVGGPLGIGPYQGQPDQVFQDWKRGITQIAACANVAVKLGGLGMPMCGFDWHLRSIPPTSRELEEAMEPHYLTCIELFGVERCMFESNFPVDKVSCSYTVLWNAFKRLTRGFSIDERRSLFHDTAAEVYRLDVIGATSS